MYQIDPQDVVKLYNLWRDLGAILDNVQPGLVNDPHSDADTADAMRLVDLADIMRRIK